MKLHMLFTELAFNMNKSSCLRQENWHVAFYVNFYWKIKVRLGKNNLKFLDKYIKVFMKASTIGNQGQQGNCDFGILLLSLQVALF